MHVRQFQHLPLGPIPLQRSLHPRPLHHPKLHQVHNRRFPMRAMLRRQDPRNQRPFMRHFTHQRQLGSQALPGQHQQSHLQTQPLQPHRGVCGCWCPVRQCQRRWVLFQLQKQRVRTHRWKVLQGYRRRWQQLILSSGKVNLFIWSNLSISFILHCFSSFGWLYCIACFFTRAFDLTFFYLLDSIILLLTQSLVYSYWQTIFKDLFRRFVRLSNRNA